MSVIRFLLAKEAAARFIGHLDLMRVLERALRRARLPVAYSAGFNPHPKLTLASALALGATSEAEVAQVQLTAPVPTGEFCERLNRELPQGLTVLQAAEVTGGGRSLAEAVEWAAYRLRVAWAGAGDPSPWPELIEAFRADETRVVKRRKDGRELEVDLRPLVRSLRVVREAGKEAELEAVLRAGSRANVRPEELVAAIGAGRPGILLRLLAVHRVGLYAEGDPDPVPLWQV